MSNLTTVTHDTHVDELYDQIQQIAANIECQQRIQQEQDETRISILTQARANEIVALEYAALTKKIEQQAEALGVVRKQNKALRIKAVQLQKIIIDTARPDPLVPEPARKHCKKLSRDGHIQMLQAEYRNLETQYQGVLQEASRLKFQAIRCGKQLEAAQQQIRDLQAQLEVVRRANELLSARVKR